ncbi:unnamed protein product [Closterium sp. NIES-53]
MRQKKLRQIDIANTFLYAPVDAEILVEQPHGSNTDPNQVCQLEKSLYDIKQAPRLLQQYLHARLVRIEFFQLPHDQGMYRLMKGTDYILLIVYVDDMLYIGSTDNVTTWFEGELQRDLTLTVSSTVTQYLGLNIQDGENAIYLSAAKYSDTIAKRFRLIPATITTPYCYTDGNRKEASAPLKFVGIRDYQRKLGFLLFAAVTFRPDLSYSASQLATHLKKPTFEHMAELDRALHYLVSTPTGLPPAAAALGSAATRVLLRCYCCLCYYCYAAAATSCFCLPWPLPLSDVSGSRVCRSLSRRNSFASGLSGGAAPVAELAVLGLKVLVPAVLVLVGGSLSRRSRFARGLSGRAAPVAEPGVLLLEVPVSLLLLVVPLVDVEVLGVDSSGSNVCQRLSPRSSFAASLGAFDSASTGAEPEKALHIFTLDSGDSRCFLRNSTTITSLTVPVPVTLADPSGGPDQWVTVTQPGGELVAICTDSRTGEHLATFTRRPGSGLYTLTTECALVAESGQEAPSVEVAASCSCRLLTHQTLLWNHRLGHPSLPRLCGIHSLLLLSGLPRSLPPLPKSLAPPCLTCVEGWQCTAPHSSFPPTTAPLQTLHMDVRGRARVPGQGGERYFLLVVDDYTRYTTVFPLQSKAEVCNILIRWIRAICLQLNARFQQDREVLRLHSDRGERRIGLVMEVARTSIVHAAAPHFMWPCVVRYAVEKLNLWPRVSHLETSPTLRWTGEVGDALPFRVWGALSLVRDPPAGKLSPRTPRCVFLGFPTDASGWQFCHPAPLPPHGPAPSGVSQVDPSPLVEPVEVSSNTSGPAEGGDPTPAATVTPRRSARLAVPPGFPPRPSSPRLQPIAVDSGGAGGGTTWGAGSGASRLRAGGVGNTGAGGAGTAGAGGSATSGTGVASAASHARTTRAGGAGATGAVGGTGGAAAVGAAAGSPGSRRQEPLSPEWLREWAVRWGSPGGGAARYGGAGPGDASAGVPGVKCAGGTGTGGTSAAGGTAGAGAAGGSRGAGRRGASAGVPRVSHTRGTGTGGTCAARGTGGADTGGTTGGTGLSGASRQESLSPLQLREWATRPSTPVRGCHIVRPRASVVPGTHRIALRPSSVPQRVVLSSPLASSLPHVLDPESDLVRAASPTVIRLLATVVTDPSFESAAASALVVDFATLCRLDYAASLVFYSSCPPSVGGELALGCDAITGPYSSQWQTAMDAEMASWKSTGTYVNAVPPPGANIVDGMWIFRVKRPPGAGTAGAGGSATSGTGVASAGGTGARRQETFSPERLREWAVQWGSPGGGARRARTGTPGAVGGVAAVGAAAGSPGSHRQESLLLQWLREWAVRWGSPGGGAGRTAGGTGGAGAAAGAAGGTGGAGAAGGTRGTSPRGASTGVLGVGRTRGTEFDFTWSSPQSTPLSTGHSLLAPPSDESVEPSGPYPELLGCLMYLMTCTQPDLAYPLSLLARYVALGRHRKVRWEAVKRILRFLCSTSGMGLVLGGPGSNVLTGHSDASWADDQTTHRPTQGYSFSLGTGSVLWRSTRSSSVLSSSCEAKIYVGAMAAQELCWLTYLLTDLGERPHSPPILYVDNKAMIALCQDQRLEHRTKHIAFRYFLTRELHQRGQLRLAYVATQANTADVFTKALGSSDHKRFGTSLGLVIYDATCMFAIARF